MFAIYEDNQRTGEPTSDSISKNITAKKLEISARTPLRDINYLGNITANTSVKKSGKKASNKLKNYGLESIFNDINIQDINSIENNLEKENMVLLEFDTCSHKDVEDNYNDTLGTFGKINLKPKNMKTPAPENPEFNPELYNFDNSFIMKSVFKTDDIDFTKSFTYILDDAPLPDFNF